MIGRRGHSGARAILPVGLRAGFRAKARIGSLVALGIGLSLLWRSGNEPGGPAVPLPALRGFMGAGDDALPYAPNRLLVQIRAAAMEPALATVPQDKGRQVPQAKTGLGSLDALAGTAGVIDISRPYGGFRNTNKANAAGVDRWFMFRFDDVSDLPDLADAFAALPEVQAVSLDWLVWPATLPSDPGFAANWGHENRSQLPAFNWYTSHTHSGDGTGIVGFDADVPPAWQLAQGYGSVEVVIAIIDSGVDLDHPDLRLVAGYDFGDDDPDPDDDAAGAGHGTCCAGIAAALNNGIGAVGVAPGCSIMPLKAANSAGLMYSSAIQSAIYYAADHGADIISMSFGAPLETDPATEAALQYAHDAGVVMLAAAGNGNRSGIFYPASSPYVIGVGAASPDGGRKRSSSDARELNAGVTADPNGCTGDEERWWGSSYGSTLPDAADAIDLLGPTILPTCDIAGAGGYQPDDVEPFFNGTSCAVPYVAGVAALVLAAVPDLTPAQVREALTATARDVVNCESGPGWDRYAGYGLVNAQAAILGVAPTGAATGPTAAIAASPVNGRAPLTVIFTDASTGAPTSWNWDFGDGDTSTAPSPSHVYAAAGTYDVSLAVSNADGTNAVTRVGLVTVAAATAALGQNEPNPFNPVTRIAFDLPQAGSVRLTVYDPRGRLVARLAEGDLPAGSHVVTWDATGHPSGLYVYRLEAPGIDETRKMLLLK